MSRSEDGVQQDEEVLSPLDPPKKRARSDSNADSANVDEIIALKLPRIVLDEALRAIDPSEHPGINNSIHIAFVHTIIKSKI